MGRNLRFPAWWRWLAGAVASLAPLAVANAYILENAPPWPAGNVVMQLQLAGATDTLLDGSTSWGQVAEAALSDWNQVLGLIQFTVVRNSTVSIGSHDGFNSVFWSTTIFGDTWGANTIGYTQYWWNGGRRTEADVLFNSNPNRLWNSYRGPLRKANDGSTLFDLKRVALHEFGHALGLNHPDGDGGQTVAAIMNANTSNTDALTADDIAGARSIYDVTQTAPAITVQPQSQTINVGGSVTFAVTATGSVPLSYQWRKDGVAIAGATSSTYAVGGLTTANAGTYSVVVSNATGSVLSSGATLTVAVAGRISNLSVRTNLAGGQTLVVGFVTSGAKNLLIRGVGPSLLTVFGLTNFYADPRFTVNDSQGVVIDQNDTWAASLSPTFSSVGAFALASGSKDAALLRSISGPNTAQVSGTGSGIMLVEVYDADAVPTSTRLTNVSARNQVGTGADILISGFVVAGTGPEKLLIRGIGPALHDVFGVNGALADPMLEIHQTINGVDTVVASNNDWSSSLTATFDTVGAYHFTTGSKDAALLITLQPGVYTAQLSGANSGTGDGVVEIYEVP